MAAAKPRVVVPGRLWEVHAGLPMEAFWCAHGPADVTLYNFAMPSTTGARQTFAVWIADPDRMRLQLKAKQSSSAIAIAIATATGKLD